MPAGYFEIYTKGELKQADCGNSANLHVFGQGRYFSERNCHGSIFITKFTD
jgi:hypothetical protein